MKYLKGADSQRVEQDYSFEKPFSPEVSQISSAPSKATIASVSHSSCHRLKQGVLKMLRTMMEEFNCNHQADIDSNELEKIYQRDEEHEKIQKFLEGNIANNKSGLLYLCGHPGTGKTSSLNYVLSELKKKGSLNFKPLLFNAMTYSDVKQFSISLYNQLHETFLEKPSKRNI